MNPAPVSRTCRLLTFGCKVNQYETQYVKETLELNGYREADEHEPADLWIVNTCTVTHEADAKARQHLRAIHRDQPNARIVVMGCYATREPDTLAKLPGVTAILPDKATLLESLRPFGIEKQVDGISRFDGHQRSFVKVQDGCLLNCTFCIIPSVRPHFRSRPLAEIVAEVERLLTTKTREIVLTGIHLGHYGIDLSRGFPKARWTRLWHLVDRLARLPGEFRIRLSSLDAAEVQEELIRVLAEHPRVCPHLHICLQSGSDRVLARMKRRYHADSFRRRCTRIQRLLDRPALTTDIIVGFPGETEADFEDTCALAREVGFAKIHVFPFSARRGTPAARFADQLPPEVIQERRTRLLELDAELRSTFIRRLVGSRLDVLVEGAVAGRPGWVQGTSCRHVQVRLAGTPGLIRQRIPVRVVGVEADVAIGVPDEESLPLRHPLPMLDFFKS
jgi:threonylcarbamoyladenosine tRNA methylthiotransferase MtaB